MNVDAYMVPFFFSNLLNLFIPAGASVVSSRMESLH